MSQAPKQKGSAQSNPLFELGKERLELIGKHADALMQGYLEGHVNELAFSQQALQKLLDSRVLFYPQERIILYMEDYLKSFADDPSSDNLLELIVYNNQGKE